MRRRLTRGGCAALGAVVWLCSIGPGCGGKAEPERFELPRVGPALQRLGKHHRARPRRRRPSRARPLPSRVPRHLVGAGRKGLLFEDAFESGRLDRWNLAWLFLRTSARIIGKPVRRGRGALEVTLRRSDPMRSKGKRSELSVPGYFALGRAYWYGFSVRLAADWKEDLQGEVVAQWFATRDKHLPSDLFRRRPHRRRLGRLRRRRPAGALTRRYFTCGLMHCA